MDSGALRVLFRARIGGNLTFVARQPSCRFGRKTLKNLFF
jgi:hypothetical protein